MKEFQFDFERLKVYQKALILIDKIFMIYKGLHVDYKMAVGTNIIRAGMSIANNLAEGNGKLSKKEKSGYFGISLDSTKECVSVFNVLYRQKILDCDRFHEIRMDSREITSMIMGLMK